jgi:hypothetical protein
MYWSLHQEGTEPGRQKVSHSREQQSPPSFTLQEGGGHPVALERSEQRCRGGAARTHRAGGNGAGLGGFAPSRGKRHLEQPISVGGRPP